jgi:hypothetical protein
MRLPLPSRTYSPSCFLNGENCSEASKIANVQETVLLEDTAELYDPAIHGEASGCRGARLVSRSASKLGFGYRLIVPIAAYVSAKGTQIEGKGITPDIDIAWSFPDAMEDRDNQLSAAIEVL